MHLIKAIILGLSASSIGFGAISGKVVDANGLALSGALIQLENAGESTITTTDGSFLLQHTSTIFNGGLQQKIPSTFSANMEKGLLYVDLAKKSQVNVSVYSFNGTRLFSNQMALEAGKQFVAMPNMAPGLKIVRVESGKENIVIKSLSMDGSSRSIPAPLSTTSKSKPLAKQASTASSLNDVISVTKGGYLNFRMAAAQNDTAGITIKMIIAAGTVEDKDGNLYQTVKIGNQEWMAENLRTTKLNDGSALQNTSLSGAWGMPGTSAFCFYGNTTNPDSIKKFGALYNWSAANERNLAPVGWHLPTDADWDALEKYLALNGSNSDGSKDTSDHNTQATNKIAKSLASMTDWLSDTTSAAVGNTLSTNNKNGFSSSPSGYRFPDGQFLEIGSGSRYWSGTNTTSTSASYRALDFNGEALKMPISYRSLVMKTCGFSIRLVKDN